MEAPSADDSPPEAPSTDDSLQYLLIRPSSIPPVKNSAGAAGFDLSADLGDGFTPTGEDLIVPPCERAFIGTGVVVVMPAGTYGRVAPRPGLALELGIDVLGGLIPHDYRGEIKVLLVNKGDKAFTIRHGDRIAQLFLECGMWNVDALRVLSIGGTPRGAGGFGSTGCGSGESMQ